MHAEDDPFEGERIMSSNLLLYWAQAASDLNLRITVPFSLRLTNENKLEAPMLVHFFGANKGMLVFTNYDDVSPYVDELAKYGYGFSVLSEPGEHENYEMEEYMELLAEWGWTGSDELKPDWL